jgi:hypothetical protein
LWKKFKICDHVKTLSAVGGGITVTMTKLHIILRNSGMKHNHGMTRFSFDDRISG